MAILLAAQILIQVEFLETDIVLALAVEVVEAPTIFRRDAISGAVNADRGEPVAAGAALTASAVP